MKYKTVELDEVLANVRGEFFKNPFYKWKHTRIVRSWESAGQFIPQIQSSECFVYFDIILLEISFSIFRILHFYRKKLAQ